MCWLPPACDTALKHFETFYGNKHSGRKLFLNAGLGSADIKAIFYGSNARDNELISQQVILKFFFILYIKKCCPAIKFLIKIILFLSGTCFETCLL